MPSQPIVNDSREGDVSKDSTHEENHAHSSPGITLDLNHRMGRGAVLIGGVVVLLVAIFIFVGIRSRAHAEEALKSDTERSAVLAVSVVKPTEGSKALEIVLPANTQAYMDTPIYARTNGYLRHWYADIGAHVHQGQLLADIETPELDQQVQQAQSDLATATANLKIAKITADRWTKLLAKDAVSKQESDQAASEFSSRTSAVASAEANVRRLQQLQGFEKIYAPFTGVITARNVDVGALIQGGDSGSPKAELFHIAETDKLRLYVPVPEIYASAVHNGERIAVTSDGAPDQKIVGTVVRTSDSIDITNRTLNVEVDVLNADHKLLTGQYAFVHLPIPPSNAAMTVPSNVLLFRGEGLRVGVVKGDHVQLVPIQIGHDYGATVEVTAGLSADDILVQDPSDSLADGEKVQVETGGER